MRKIKLKNVNRFTFIDDEDYKKISQYSWYLNRTTTQVSTGIKRDGKWKIVHLSRFLMGEPLNMEVDHKNHNRLDNQKNNLRVCTTTENHQNTLKHCVNKSGYKGVSFNKSTGKWEARIRVNKRKLHLGLFIDKKRAAIAYDMAAKVHFKKFALLNA